MPSRRSRGVLRGRGRWIAPGIQSSDVGDVGTRRSRAPQVVQTSAMDCGPAVLTAVLRGYGLAANLEATRDLCATGVDGTSIDVIEDLARTLGLDATQRVVPPDHLMSAAVELLPAIVVTELPDGLLHFVVLWRRWGSWVEVMDPAIGRHWVRWAHVSRDLYRHEMTVPATAWRDYAASDRFCDPLRERLSACGFGNDRIDRLIDAAVDDPTWESLAWLDAAARRAQRSDSTRYDVMRWVTDPSWAPLRDDMMVVPVEGEDPVVPVTGAGTSPHPDVPGTSDGTATAGSAPPSELVVDQLTMRGAVVLSISGVDPDVVVPDELAARVLVAEPSPVAVLVGLLDRRAIRRTVAAITALAVGSGGMIAAAFVLQRLIDPDTDGSPGAVGGGAVGGGSVGGVAAWTGLLLVLCAIASWWGTTGVVAIGREVEIELRRRIEDRVGIFPDRFFASRPASDLAERAHGLHRLRDIASSLAELCVASSQVLAATVVMIIIAPSAWWAVLVLVVAMIGVPMAFGSSMVERESRSRTIAGAMSHSYLDALIGALPVRAHRAGRAILAEHGELLDRWATAESSRQRVGATATGVTFTIGYVLAALVVVTARGPAGGPGTAPGATAVVAFAAFVVVTAASMGVSTVRRLMPQWVTAQRLLALSEVDLLPTPAELPGEGPIGIDLRGVGVDGDHGALLEDVSISIRPGEHVTLVGPSGAGKSTLVATILGWIPPDRGSVLVDGADLDPAHGVALRRATAWVDPDLAIWSGSLAENIMSRGPADVYGTTGAGDSRPGGTAVSDIDAANTLADDAGVLDSVLIDSVGLQDVARRLDPTTGLLPEGVPTGPVDGLVTRLGVGEDGRLLSGGEAQRVRIVRALARVGPRLAILDEADRGLDDDLRNRVREALDRRFAGTTTITVTHDLNAAATADRVMVVDGGKVTADGAPSVLLADPNSALSVMMAEHRTLEASFTAKGWGTAELRDGRLVLDRVAQGDSAADQLSVEPLPTEQESLPTPGEPEPDTGRLASNRLENRGPRVTGSGRTVVALAIAAVVVMGLEWNTFVAGWAVILRDPPRPWGVGLLVLAGTAAGLTTLAFGLAGMHFSVRLRRRLLIGGITAPLDRIRTLGSGDLMGRVLESETFQQHAVTGGTDMAMGLAQLLAAIVLAAVTNAWLVVVLIVLWSIGLVTSAAVATRERHGWTTERIDRTKLLLSRFRGRRTESVYGPPPRADSRHLLEYWRLSIRSDRWKCALLANADFWLAVAVVSTVATQPPGRRGVALAAVVLAWGGFSGLGVAMDELASAAASLRSFAVLDRLGTDHERTPGGGEGIAAPPSSSDVANEPAAVTVSGLYDGRGPDTAPLFDGLDWHLTPGTRTVLRGPSGCGKSTLAQIIAGLQKPSAGMISGHERVVYVPQFGDNHTMQASLAFNLLLARDWLPTSADIEDAYDVLDQLDLGRVVDAMPRGIVQPVGEAGWQLSHGERARLHLARALLQGGHTIIMDETLEGLDAATARLVLDAVCRRYSTVVLVHHR